MACTAINRADVHAVYIRGPVALLRREIQRDAPGRALCEWALQQLESVAADLEAIAAAAPDPDDQEAAHG